jgi:hypothetical protein
MNINSAADLAAILDPAHEVEGWWMFDCPECGASNPNSHYSACFDKPALVWTFTGPADLHTAREHAWRLEDWLEARGCSWYRERFPSGVVRTQVYKRVERPDDCSPSHLLIGGLNTNHTVALLSAIEKVSE